MNTGRLPAARSLALYLLSLHAVASAVLAWPPSRLGVTAALVGASAGLALVVVAGEAFSPALDALLERRARSRLRISVGVAYVGLVLVALGAAIGAGDAGLLVAMVALFGMLQAVFLLFLEVLGGPVLALANALILVTLACFAGGALAAVAVTGYVAWLAFFLAFDHFQRRLAAFPATRASLLRAAVGQATVAAAPPVLLMAVLLAVAPPQPYAHISRDERRVSPSSRLVRRVYGHLLLLGLAGAALVLVARRVLRPGPGGGERTEEILEPERGGEEVLGDAPAATAAPPLAGTRGRIFRAYLRFLEEAELRVLRRRPSHTPAEIALQLREPAEPLHRLTALFMAARYGPGEPGLDEARAAESAADHVVTHLKRRAR